MMGDFNAVLDVELDRSHKTSTPGITATFLRYMKQFQLIDVWRQANPDKRDYTFFFQSITLHIPALIIS